MGPFFLFIQNIFMADIYLFVCLFVFPQFVLLNEKKKKVKNLM
jgi:hypothetical protein